MLGETALSAGDSVVLADAGSLTFVPVANWNGETSFTYSAVDNDGAAAEASPATILITVTPTSDVFSEMDIQIGTKTDVTSLTTDFTDSSSFEALKNSELSTFTTANVTLTASDGDTLNWRNGQGIGVGSDGGFRIFGDESLTFEYIAPFNTIDLELRIILRKWSK